MLDPALHRAADVYRGSLYHPAPPRRDPIMAALLSRIPAADLPVRRFRRVLTCRIPAAALDRLRAGAEPVLEAAEAALRAGLESGQLPESGAAQDWPRRLLAVPVGGEAFAAVVRLAEGFFGGDARDAAGWLIASGLGLVAPPQERVLATFEIELGRETDGPKPDWATELRQRREALGLNKQELAEMADVGRSTIYGAELGGWRVTARTLRRIRAALDELEGWTNA